MNILWVENNHSFVQIVLKTFLARHEVVVMPSLEAARQALSKTSFDVVLLDYDLNDGKGTELLPIVKELPNVPFVIAASSHVAGNVRLRQAGADAVCSKQHFAELEDVLTNKPAK